MTTTISVPFEEHEDSKVEIIMPSWEIIREVMQDGSCREKKWVSPMSRWFNKANTVSDFEQSTTDYHGGDENKARELCHETKSTIMEFGTNEIFF